MTATKKRFAWSVGILSVLFPVLPGCAHSDRVTTVGFPGARQDRFPAHAGTYDLREDVDDSPDFYHGNFDPFPDPLFPGEY